MEYIQKGEQIFSIMISAYALVRFQYQYFTNIFNVQTRKTVWI